MKKINFLVIIYPDENIQFIFIEIYNDLHFFSTLTACSPRDTVNVQNPNGFYVKNLQNDCGIKKKGYEITPTAFTLVSSGKPDIELNAINATMNFRHKFEGYEADLEYGRLSVNGRQDIRVSLHVHLIDHLELELSEASVNVFEKGERIATNKLNSGTMFKCKE